MSKKNNSGVHVTMIEITYLLQHYDDIIHIFQTMSNDGNKKYNTNDQLRVH